MKVYTVHNGCESNLYDSEKVKEISNKSGLESARSLSESDIVVFHSCTFSDYKETESIEIIKNLLKETDSKIIVSGCFLGEYVSDSRIKYIKNEKIEGELENVSKFSLIKTQEIDSLTPIVQISKGCYGSCTFCSIKSVKGVHKSQPVEIILSEIAKIAKKHPYVKLVGEEVAGYGRDNKSNLLNLFNSIANEFPNLGIKFGSLNLKILKLYSEEELKMFSHKNIFGNIHIPVQSASNDVLSLMDRGYKVEEYIKVYNYLKLIGVKRISGDLICGFPYETENDHNLNIEFLKKFEFEFLEVFKYETRPNTEASQMEQLSEEIKNFRTSDVLFTYLNAYCSFKGVAFDEVLNRKPIFNTNINFSL